MRLDRILPFVIALYFLTSMISITIGQAVLGAAFAIWVVWCVTERRPPSVPKFFWPLLVYAGLSLIASVFSDNQAVSFWDSRELLFILLVPIVYMSIRSPRSIRWAGWALLASALLDILRSFYAFLFTAAPGERISGFMDHYMTQAGLLLLFAALALSQTLFSKGKQRLLWGGSFALAAAALILTLTRNAWVGLIVVVCLLLWLYKPKTLILVPVLIALFFLFSPSHVKQRALSIFDPQSYSNAQRIEYFRAGVQIIRDYPLFGTGPNTVHVIFQKPQYGLSQDARDNVHLHNNLLQIAAERGIATLIAWLVFLVWAALGLVRMMRERQSDPLLYTYAAGALAALLGFFAAGFFEYNWGDSEVVMLFLCLIALPFGLERGEAASEESS
jgi:O-antigen ligase